MAGGTAFRNYIHEAMKRHGPVHTSFSEKSYSTGSNMTLLILLLQAQKDLIQNYFNNTKSTPDTDAMKNNAVPNVYYITQECGHQWIEKCRANEN